MPLTVAEAEAAARALRGWPEGRSAYALAWEPKGVGYHQSGSLARALRNGVCTMEQLGPAATIAMMRHPRPASGTALAEGIAASYRDLRVELVMTPRDWVRALGDPPALAARLEQWAAEMRAFLRGEVLQTPRSQTLSAKPSKPDPPAEPVVPLSATAREALRLLVGHPEARMYYDRQGKAWFVAGHSTRVRHLVRSRTAGWMVSEALVELEELPSGVRREDQGLQYVPSAHGRRCLAAEEAGETA